MEHTHLVKGLDFALLAKMRSEEEVKDTIKEAAMENALEDAAKPTVLPHQPTPDAPCPSRLLTAPAVGGVRHLTSGEIPRASAAGSDPRRR